MGIWEYGNMGISNYAATERTIQYIIFKELCKNYKIIPQDRGYHKTQQRLDLSIYNELDDRDQYGEIGVELKWVNY